MAFPLCLPADLFRQAGRGSARPQHPLVGCPLLPEFELLVGPAMFDNVRRDSARFHSKIRRCSRLLGFAFGSFAAAATIAPNHRSTGLDN